MKRGDTMERWQNQEEAYQFAMAHPATMLAMDMGTGKTKVAIDISMDRQDQAFNTRRKPYITAAKTCGRY